VAKALIRSSLTHPSAMQAELDRILETKPLEALNLKPGDFSYTELEDDLSDDVSSLAKGFKLTGNQKVQYFVRSRIIETTGYDAAQIGATIVSLLVTPLGIYIADQNDILPENYEHVILRVRQGCTALFAANFIGKTYIDGLPHLTKSEAWIDGFTSLTDVLELFDFRLT